MRASGKNVRQSRIRAEEAIFNMSSEDDDDVVLKKEKKGNRNKRKVKLLRKDNTLKRRKYVKHDNSTGMKSVIWSVLKSLDDTFDETDFSVHYMDEQKRWAITCLHCQRTLLWTDKYRLRTHVEGIRHIRQYRRATIPREDIVTDDIVPSAAVVDTLITNAVETRLEFILRTMLSK